MTAEFPSGPRPREVDVGPGMSRTGTAGRVPWETSRMTRFKCRDDGAERITGTTTRPEKVPT